MEWRDKMEIIVIETNPQFDDFRNAIIVRAAKDYKLAVRKLEKDPSDIAALIDKVNIENFFCSEWFSVLSDACGETMLNKLKETLKE